MVKPGPRGRVFSFSGASNSPFLRCGARVPGECLPMLARGVRAEILPFPRRGVATEGGKQGVSDVAAEFNPTPATRCFFWSKPGVSWGCRIEPSQCLYEKREKGDGFQGFLKSPLFPFFIFSIVDFSSDNPTEGQYFS